MSVPASLSPSPLVGLGDASYKPILEDDYSVGKFSLKAKAVTATAGTVNFKNAYSLADLKASQEFKVQFPWRNYYLWLGTRGETSEAKLHVDFGEVDLLTKHRWFSSVNFYKKEFKVGQTFQTDNSLVHSRFTFRRGKWLYLNRGTYRKGDTQITWSDEFNFEERRFSRYDDQIAYFTSDTDFFLRHTSLASPNFTLFAGHGIGRLAADIVHRRGKNTFAAEVAFNGPADFGVALGVGTKINHHTIKARVNPLDQSIAFAVKGKLHDIFGYTVALDSKAKPGLLPLPIGLTLEVAL